MHPQVYVVTVTTATTEVKAVSASRPFNKMRVEPAKANTGRIYIGTDTLDIASLAGLIADLPAPGAGAGGSITPFELEAAGEGAVFDLLDYKFDASVSGEKCVVTVWGG